MEIKSKIFGYEEIKEEGDKGLVVARFATFNVVDHDGDVTPAGAFGEQKALILYQHQRSEPPIGRSEIYEEKDAALARLVFNLKMARGREVFESVKMSDELQEYSYGYDVVKARYGNFKTSKGEREVRFLEKLKVGEVSPVLVGSGIDTGTVDIKAMKAERQKAVSRMEALDGELEIRKRRATLLGVTL